MFAVWSLMGENRTGQTALGCSAYQYTRANRGTRHMKTVVHSGQQPGSRRDGRLPANGLLAARQRSSIRGAAPAPAAGPGRVVAPARQPSSISCPDPGQDQGPNLL